MIAIWKLRRYVRHDRQFVHGARQFFIQVKIARKRRLFPQQTIFQRGRNNLLIIVHIEVFLDAGSGIVDDAP